MSNANDRPIDVVILECEISQLRGIYQRPENFIDVRSSRLRDLLEQRGGRLGSRNDFLVDRPHLRERRHRHLVGDNAMMHQVTRVLFAAVFFRQRDGR